MKYPLIVGTIISFLISSTTAYADCRGCCSSHGGVVCSGGVTQCADGSPLSDTCINKGCNKCGSVSPGTYTYYRDDDGDSYGDPNISISSTDMPPGYVKNAADCNDNDPTINPLATEIRGDGIDQDCNGSDLPALVTYYRDFDGDLYGDPDRSGVFEYPISGYVTNSSDCNDFDSSIFPGATEIADDGIDQDCNGIDLVTQYEDDTIKVANFNIQVFGVTKAGKPQVMDILARTIAEFDIVAIQEIRDISETAIVDLENEVDALGVDYTTIIGPRLGRTSSKEQYAYMFRTDLIEYIDAYTFDDSGSDDFHREPLIAQFKATSGNFDFVLVTLHTDPDEATEEINALPDVLADAKNYFSENDIIVLGDLNADCSYFDEDDPDNPMRGDGYNWLIGNDMDTNLAASSCTYDRIIILDDSQGDFTGDAGVYRFDDIYNLTEDDAEDVSDHYPVWAEFYTNKDNDNTPQAIVLTEASPNTTVEPNGLTKIYGTTGVNSVTIASGAEVELINFPGANNIIIESQSTFTVCRTGTKVIFNGSDGTKIMIPATTTQQSINFNGIEKVLVIDSGRVMIGDQVVNLDSAQIE